MKKSFIRALPLLLMVPNLMAASSISTVNSEKYTDYALTYQRVDIVDDDYYYYFDLNNTGDGYIEYLSFTESFYSDYVYASEYYAPFNNAVFGPGVHKNISFRSSTKIDNVDSPKSKSWGYANFATEIQVGGSKEVTFVNKGLNYYLYNIDMSLNGEKEKNKIYGVILEAEYNGSKYYIRINDAELYNFSTEEEIDLTKLVVNDIKVIKSVEHDSDYYIGLIIDIVTIVVFLVLIPFGIFAAIFFPAMARKRRRKKAKAAQ